MKLEKDNEMSLSRRTDSILIKVQNQLLLTNKLLEVIDQTLIPYRGQIKITHNGYAIAKWGFANQKMEIVIPCIYDKVEHFSEGYAVVMHFEKRSPIFRYINKRGEIKKELQTPNKAFSFSGRVAVNFVITDYGFFDYAGGLQDPIGYYNVIDEEFNVISTIEGKEFLYTPIFINGFSKIKKTVQQKDRKWKEKLAFIDKFGRQITDYKYDFLGDFSCGRAKFIIDEDNKKFGYLDINGNEILPSNYYEATDFNNGYAYVNFIESYYIGFINTDGEKVQEKNTGVENSYDELKKSFENGKYGFVNLFGKLVIPYEYDETSNFSGGLCFVRKKISDSKNLYGIINKEGKELIECKIDFPFSFRDFYKGSILVQDKEYKYFMITQEGKKFGPYKIHRMHEFRNNGLIEVATNPGAAYVDYLGNEYWEH